MTAEFEVGDYILVLDGRTFEIFYRGASESMRYHVAFLGVDAKPHGGEFKVHLGARHRDQILGGAKLKMGREEFERFNGFIAQAIAARDRTSQ